MEDLEQRKLQLKTAEDGSFSQEFLGEVSRWELNMQIIGVISLKCLAQLLLEVCSSQNI